MPTWRKAYVLGLLLFVTISNQIDRQVLSILIEPIKHEFHASDTAMGLIAGTFFMVFYMAGGLPIARLADVKSRRVIIAACVGAWSVATAVSGAVQSYAQLALARTCVAVGEGGCAPAITSLLAEIIPQRLRVRALSVISSGSAIGVAFGTFLGGTLSEMLGWRMVFLVVSIPGFILAPLIWLTLPEPREKRAPSEIKKPPRVREALLSFWRIPSYRALAVVAFAGGYSGFATLAWMPSFMIRVHHLSKSEVGIKLGLALVLGMMFGNLSSGYLADRFKKRSPSWIMWITGMALTLAVPFGLASVFVTDANLGFIYFGCFSYLLAFWPPTVAASAVGVVDPRAKTLSASAMLVFQSVAGALGPFIIGAMNDGLSLVYGPMAIRYSVALSIAFLLVGAVGCFFAGRSLVKDYRPTND